MLHVYGCSFTAGGELADETLTGYSREQTEIIKQKLGQSNFTKKYILSLTSDQREEFWNLEKKRSYATSLANGLGVPHRNAAQNGASTKQMCFEIIKDIIDGVIKKEDYIFLGLTTPYRYTLFDNDNRMKTSQVMDDNWPNNTFKDQILGTLTDNDWLFDLVLTINSLKSICKDYNFYYSHTLRPYTAQFNSSEVSMYIWKEIEKIDQKAVLPETYLGAFVNGNRNDTEHYAFKHPHVKYHEPFGMMLAEKIKKLQSK